MSQSNIPDKIINFNVYSDTEKLLGVSGEVTLPDFEPMTETLSGAGILGEIESPTPGHFGSQEIEIQFRTLTQSAFKVFENDSNTFIFRAAQQSRAVTSNKSEVRPLKIVVKGASKGGNLGKLGVGAPTETTVKLEIYYIKVEENGETLLELDKLNCIYVVNGVDKLADIRNAI